MKIAVLSGKGGTGKTFISVNLADCLDNTVYVDCDVEEPNGHLFFKPIWSHETIVSRKIPVVDQDLCNGCRVCTEFCQFNALAYVRDKVIVFEDICHSCGGCSLLCPEKAITEIDKAVGKVQVGMSKDTMVYTGTMLTKEVSGIPIIHQLMDSVRSHDNVIIDCPPGSACSVMESIKEADYCLLVAEPTVFGKHNLNMVYELVRLFNKPYGVVLNKCMEGENPSKSFCIENNIPILIEIPYDTQLGKYQSEGLIPSREDDETRKLFLKLIHRIEEVVSRETTINS